MVSAMREGELNRKKLYQSVSIILQSLDLTLMRLDGASWSMEQQSPLMSAQMARLCFTEVPYNIFEIFYI